MKISGHSLGFWHEQSRFDRDNYIKVLSQNIKDGMEGQFGMEGQRDFQANGYPYDLGSVMHYGRTVRALSLCRDEICHMFVVVSVLSALFYQVLI